MTSIFQVLRPGTQPGLRALLGGLLDEAVRTAEADELREVGLYHLLLHLADTEEGAAAIRLAGGSPQRLQASIRAAMDLDRVGLDLTMPPSLRGRFDTAARARELSATELQGRVWAATRAVEDTLGGDAGPHRILLLTLAGLGAGSCSVCELALRQSGLEGLIDEEEIRDRIEAELRGLRGPLPDRDFDDDLPEEIQDLLRDAERVRDEDLPPEPAPPPPTPAPPPPAPQPAAKKGEENPEVAVRAALRNLSKLAAEGKLQPAYGREEIIARVISALSRRRKGSVLLHGEPGVGKTAIAEGTALALRRPGVDKALAARPIYEVPLSRLVAGTRFRGDFELRMETLMRIALEENAILFIDEVHLLVGSGSSATRGMDGANILKPALANGEATVIGATTSAEMRLLRSDGALMRRFEPIAVREPSLARTKEILERSAKGYLDHHRVTLGRGLIDAILDMSERHFPERRLPDKAFDLLDMACVAAREEGGPRRVEKPHLEQAARRLGARLPGLPPEPLRSQLASLPARIAAELPGAAGLAPRLGAALAAAAMGFSRGRNAGTFALREREPGAARRLVEAVGRHLDLPVVTVDVALRGRADLLERLIGSNLRRDPLEPQGELVEAADRHDEMILLLEGMDRTHEAVEALVLEIAARGMLEAANGRRLRMAGCWLVLATGGEPTDRGPLGFGGSEAGPSLLEGLAPALAAQVLEAFALEAAPAPPAHRDLRAVIDAFRTRGLEIQLSPEAGLAVGAMLAREAVRDPAQAADRVALALSGLVMGIDADPEGPALRARAKDDRSVLFEMAPAP